MIDILETTESDGGSNREMREISERDGISS
jgi:hypothetical protein